MILTVYYFVAMTIKLLMAEQIPLAFRGSASEKTTDSLFAAALTYQEVVVNHWEELPPPLKMPEEEQ